MTGPIHRDCSRPSKAASVGHTRVQDERWHHEPRHIALSSFADLAGRLDGRSGLCAAYVVRLPQLAASVMRPLPPHFLARLRIDFSIRLDWLRDRWKSGTIACRAFNLSLLRGLI